MAMASTATLGLPIALMVLIFKELFPGSILSYFLSLTFYSSWQDWRIQAKCKSRSLHLCSCQRVPSRQIWRGKGQNYRCSVQLWQRRVGTTFSNTTLRYCLFKKSFLSNKFIIPKIQGICQAGSADFGQLGTGTERIVTAGMTFYIFLIGFDSILCHFFTFQTYPSLEFYW